MCPCPALYRRGSHQPRTLSPRLSSAPHSIVEALISPAHYRRGSHQPRTLSSRLSSAPHTIVEALISPAHYRLTAQCTGLYRYRLTDGSLLTRSVSSERRYLYNPVHRAACGDDVRGRRVPLAVMMCGADESRLHLYLALHQPRQQYVAARTQQADLGG